MDSGQLPFGRFKLKKYDSYTGEYKDVASGYLVSEIREGKPIKVGSISSRDFYQTSQVKKVLKVEKRKADDGSDLYTVKLSTESGSVYELKQFD